MKTLMIAAFVALATAGAALAQDEAQVAAAQTLVLPMMQEMTPGKAGEMKRVASNCVPAAFKARWRTFGPTPALASTVPVEDRRSTLAPASSDTQALPPLPTITP